MKAPLKKVKFKFSYDRHVLVILALFVFLGTTIYLNQAKITNLKSIINILTQEKDKNLDDLKIIAQELDDLKNQDQLKRNDALQEEIKNIQISYNSAVSIYEELLELKTKTNKTNDFDEMFSKSLKYLSDKNYASASSTLSELKNKISEENKKISASISIPTNVEESSIPPGSGYKRQSVPTEVGNFMVSLVAADLSTTKIIVDTASDTDCTNECPVLPLSTYVARNGAFAGINGSYFCPSTYPTCAGKTNSFDLLLMNHKKTYFNSGNNVYSNNPAVIFADNYIRFVQNASEWGRDTSPYGVLSNYPLLIKGGGITFSGDEDPKKGSKGGRSFVANKGNTVYIGVVHNATVAESAKALKALGMENALNLDDGGSTALWSGGYKVGPGRDLPNVILFVKK